MLSRVLVAVVGIPLILIVLLFCPPVCLPIVLCVMDVLIVYELLWATGALKQKRLVVYAAMLGMFVPFWLYFDGSVVAFVAAAFLYLTLVGLDAVTSAEEVTFEQICMTFFAGLVVPMMLATLVLIADEDHSRYLVLLPFVSAFISDAFALFAGMLFGKHKLAPKLSPKKTIEGSIGGFVGAVLGCFVYGLVVELISGAKADYFVLLLYGLLASLLAQVGDLFFSYIKREYGIKDYGKLLPGHGGVLDRFDSVIFCAPFTFIMVHYLTFFQF
ncbi:MAG: phosphatidate cytidylyltransferase [Clostridiales bacterium]|nr:phosphatidate cytidylyltransferase [Clostridiales bacterium]